MLRRRALPLSSLASSRLVVTGTLPLPVSPPRAATGMALPPTAPTPLTTGPLPVPPLPSGPTRLPRRLSGRTTEPLHLSNPQSRWVVEMPL